MEQTFVRESLCEYARLISARVLEGFPVTLSQGCFTYGHDLYSSALYIVSNLSRAFAESQAIHVYGYLPEMQASVSPQETISPTFIVM